MFTKWGLTAVFLIASSHSALAQSDSLLKEWRFLTVRNELVKSNAPYLVLDSQSQKVEIRLGGGVVWEMEEDSGTTKLNVKKFIEDFHPDSAQVYSVASVQLLQYEPRFPDSLLEIVSGAMDMDPTLLQREIPVMFEVQWRHGPRLLVHSKPEGQPIPVQISWRVKLDRWLSKFGGTAGYDVQIDREHALTLYRVLREGAPLLVIR